MDCLYICNTASDYISRINVEKFIEANKIPLNSRFGKSGPHGICCWKSDIITANSYSNSISKIDIINGKEMGSYYIGGNCNDVEVYRDEAYITCGEANNLTIFDLNINKIVEEIPCGNFPHSISINRQKGLIAVANMESDSVTIIDCSDKEHSKEIKVGSYPTKAIFSKDKEYIYVCESNLDSDDNGAISIISLNSLTILKRISVGKGPVDLCCDDKLCYISNFTEGSISIVYLKDMEEIKKVYLGGMPRGIVNKDRYLFIGDNYCNTLIRYDIYKDRKKSIPIGGEPTGMILV
jgi:YVTN family beta-propeller protein